MVKTLKGARFSLFVAALFSTNFIIMTDYVIFPIVDALYSLFPDQVDGVNFVVSGPSLIIVFASLMVPLVLRRIDRKTLLLIGCAAFAVSAIGGCAIQSVPYMIACRSVGGITYAIAQVCAISIISDFWVDEGKRATMVGFYNTAQAGAGALMSFVAGNLAVTDWTHAYMTYWIAVPVFLLILVFVPKMSKGDELASETGASPESALQNDASAKRGLGIHFWVMAICFAIMTLSFMLCMNTFISVYVAENNLGDSALAGLLSSLGAVGSAAMCSIFGLVYGKLARKASIPFYFVLAGCVILMFLYPSAPLAMVCCTLAGGCFGSTFSYAYAAGTAIVAHNQIDRATGVVTASYGIGVFATTYFATFLMDALGANNVTDIFPVVAAMLIVSGFIEVARIALGSKRQAKQTEQR